MQLRRLAFSLAAALSVAGAASAAAWHPVPGAPEVEVDLASLQQERTLVRAWVRWWGTAHGARPPRVQRTAARTEFDCSRRTMRTLATNAYDGGGAALSMSSTPGPVLPVQGEDMGWTYDAVCEAARAAGRF